MNKTTECGTKNGHWNYVESVDKVLGTETPASPAQQCRRGPGLMIPSIGKCVEVMDDYGMLANIRDHSFVVAKLVYAMATQLRASGMDISLEKATAGALLHDIGKTKAIRSGGDHSLIGRDICLENHFHEIADIVAEHVILKDKDLLRPFTEKKIVFYCDKRVNHDRIVSLDERRAYILERYARGHRELSARINGNFEYCLRLEGILFSKMDIDPAFLAGLAERSSSHLDSIDVPPLRANKES